MQMASAHLSLPLSLFLLLLSLFFQPNTSAIVFHEHGPFVRSNCRPVIETFTETKGREEVVKHGIDVKAMEKRLGGASRWVIAPCWSPIFGKERNKEGGVRGRSCAIAYLWCHKRFVHAYLQKSGKLVAKEARGLAFIIHEAFMNRPEKNCCQKMLPKWILQKKK